MQYQPPVVGRSVCGYVGLRNAGATCYMNSVLQQLYMTKNIREVSNLIKTLICINYPHIFPIPQIILSAELEPEDEL